MQDVIFNGSANRKPVARASVELLFDNSLGAATGAWAQYAEISVKRVLQRDGGSDYYINNNRVRRRDIADLFLGTGLGSRAYAIIGQNTISRIIEAKPEELRVFLEEAAGVSKYKERRRETEARLSDARENLARVEDIRGEIATQISRLKAQAEITRRYQELEQTLKRLNAQIWLLKKQEAAHAWEKTKRQVERLVNESEAEVAHLRSIEATLAELRIEQHSANLAMNAAQGSFYEANAQALSASQKLQHAQENCARLERQITEYKEELEHYAALREEYHLRVAKLQETQNAATEASQRAQIALNEARAAVSATDAAQQESLARVNGLQAAMHQVERQLQAERIHQEHAARSLADIAQRLRRIEEEKARLTPPDAELLRTLEHQNKALSTQLEAMEAELTQLVETEQQQTQQLKAAQHEVQQAARHIAQLEAQFAALDKLQHALGQEQKLEGWLRHIGIDGSQRFWQSLGVEPGWETAVEAVLGSRLNGIPGNTDIAFGSRPPAVVVVYEPVAATPEAPAASSRRRLGEIVHAKDARSSSALADWLAGVYLVEEGEDLATLRHRLRPGELLVNRAGDIFTRHSITLYAAQSNLHGVLERQRELDRLAAQLPKLHKLQQAREGELQQQEQALHAQRRAIAQQQQLLRQLAATSHAQRLEWQRLQQQAQHIAGRHQQLDNEQALLEHQHSQLEAKHAEHTTCMQALEAQQAKKRQEYEAAAVVRQQTEANLRAIREQLLQAERSAQRTAYEESILSNNINELKDKLNSLHKNMGAISARLEEVQKQHQAEPIAKLQEKLELVLQQQRTCEEALAKVRNAQAEIDHKLQEMERSRLQTEQRLHPLRDRLEQARLQEQQARLACEHAAQQLLACGYDEAILAAEIAPSAKPATLEQEAVALKAQIAELGPVNLAAIQELASANERKNYLDSQVKDLETAIATLENAIRRIDRETRSRLQRTFDEANHHFAELFISLFGGGQAKLQLRGEGILDAGLEVFAQPPGKKNSSIHLLSGGEKALTALAMVFALFRLNPAPFCLMDEVDASLDDTNTERFCALVHKVSERTQFLFVTHNKIAMEMAQQLIGITMQESGVSRIVEVDIEAARKMQTELAL